MDREMQTDRPIRGNELLEEQQLQVLRRRFGPLPEPLELATRWLIRFQEAGHVCLPLDRAPADWPDLLGQEPDETLSTDPISIEALREHPMVLDRAEGDGIWVCRQEKLWFRKRWLQERFVADELQSRAARRIPLGSEDRLNDLLEESYPSTEDEIDWQKVACWMALNRQLSVISGGPGTGKTTTVARIVRLYEQWSGSHPSIALVAPTGKAAARMEESLREQLGEEQAGSLWSGTLHRWLQPFRHPRMFPSTNRQTLQEDFVILDEASMVDLTLFHTMLRHISPETRLVILGDHHQLASVESGALLAQICRQESNRFHPDTLREMTNCGLDASRMESDPSLSPLEDATVYLKKSYRFGNDSGIGRLADAIRNGDGSSLEQVMDDSPDDLEVVPFMLDRASMESICSRIEKRLKGIQEATPEEMFEMRTDHIYLTSMRHGRSGTQSLNRWIENELDRRGVISRSGTWYHGRPVIATKNDYELRVFNGEMGVCVEEGGRMDVWFASDDGAPKRIPTQRLRWVEPAWFLTIHKSQGSEYDEVELLLPEESERLLSRESIYTAVTRARKRLVLWTDKDRLIRGIQKRSERFSGLSGMLFGEEL
ncbi:MAG: exodeoxyribonuclease V subunit alpha [Balneolaceae bacterium]